MIRLLKPLAAKLWLAFLLTIILAGILVGAARLLLPQVAELRAEVQAWASERLDRPVQIGSLGASWRGLGPQLVLSDVALLSRATGESVLNLAEVRVDLDLVGSLASGALQASRLTVAGARLLVKRRSDGSIAVGGLEDLQGTQGDASGLFLLPRRLQLVDSDIYWQNLAIGGRPMRFSDVRVALVNDGERHQIEASLGMPGGMGGVMELAADVTGRADQSAGWTAEVYLRGRRLALSRLLRDRLPPGYTFESGTADLQAWSRWEGGRLQQGWGRLDLDRAVLTGPESRRLDLPHAGGRLRWSRIPTGWRLEAADLALQREGRSWPSTAFALESRLGAEGEVRVRFGTEFLRIEDVLAVVEMFPAPENRFTNAIRTTAPSGDLRDLALRYAGGEEGPRWSARGSVRGLHTRAWERVPGVADLDGRFRADQDGGRAYLDSRGLALDFPRLFRQPLELRRLYGETRWGRLDGGGIRVDAPHIVAANADIRTRTRLALEIPPGPQASPRIDLQTEFYDGDGAHAGRYYPVGIMGDDLVRWLDRSIVNGQVTSGGVIVRGPLEDFPFHRTHSGRFEVLFGVEGGLLDYREGWPRLEQLTAEVRFLNNSFEAEVYGAEILGSRVTRARARIANLHPITPLEIEGRARGPLSDQLRLLRETPLREQFGELADGLEGGGPAALDLAFRLPLKRRSGQSLELEGTLDFDGSSLTLPDWGVELGEVRGRLAFTESAVHGTRLQARAFGEPVRLDVETPAEAGLTRVTAGARLGGEALLELLPQASILGARGAADWVLGLEIPHRRPSGRPPSRLTLRSDLDGMGLELPAPLGKAPEGPRDFRLETQLVERGDFPLAVAYGDLVDSALLLQREPGLPPTLLRGELRLGGGVAELPAREGLRLRGRLPELDLAPWLALGKEQGVEMSARPTVPVESVDLDIGRLRYRDALTLERFVLDLSSTADAWSGAVACDLFEGFVRIPRDLEAAPIEARMDRMDLQVSVAEAVEPDRGDRTAIDPRGLPGLDLRVNKLRVNDHDFGKLVFRALAVPQGLRLERLDLDADRLGVEAGGTWLHPSGGEVRTELDFDLATDNLGKLLSGMGFSPNVQAERSTLSGTLEWPGSPLDLDQRVVDGRMRMRIGEGRFLQVDPGAGRVFGLLSIGTLQRRLSLDFSDLIDKGLSFDEIAGSFTLIDGDAFTNDLRIEGPSARVELAGRIGLVSQDYDQIARVTPEISSSLPVAGALAGGPAVGAALLLAQQVLGSEVDRIGSYRFRVTGPWSDPEIERLEEDQPEPESGAESAEGIWPAAGY